jgi:hypothetical protein
MPAFEEVLIADPNTVGAVAQVAQFHNADNQQPGSSAYGILTGGVAQLLNPAGNLDRQRETGRDGIPSLGIATGTQQLGSAFTVTGTIAGTGAQTITPSAMAGFNKGAAWSIQVGSVLVIESTPIGGPVPANQETVVVTAITSTTFTATFAKSHTGSVNIQGWVYNQAKDATIADGTAGEGISAGATYLFNSTLNTGAGGWEGERSAAGELDGASGTGTAVAAEYEFNAGGPLAFGNTISQLSFDRARNLQGKGAGSSTLNGAVASNVTSLTLNAVLGLLPGMQIRLDRGQAGEESAYVATSYTIGSTTVPLQSATLNAHGNGATVEWDVFAAGGPGLSGFTPAGIGIEEEALYNPVDGKYYIERSATQDGVAGANVVMENEGLLNGSGTMDRMKGNYEVTVLASAARTTSPAAQTLPANTNGHWLHVLLNVTSAGTGSITLAINGVDPASGATYPLLTGTAVTTNGMNVYRVGPALTPSANSVANDYLPRTVQITVTHNNANSITYSVGAVIGE